MLRRCGWLIPLLFLLALTQPVLGASPRSAAEIDPRVLADLSSGSARLIIRLKTPPPQPTILTTDSLLQDRAVSQVSGLRAAAGAAQAALSADLESQGVSFRSYWIVNALSLQAGPGLLARLASRPDVLSIESDRPFQVPLETAATLSAAAAIQPGLSLVKAPSLWAMGFRGQGTVVASADTGVEWQHPALLSHYRGWNGSTADHNYNWWDAIHSQVRPFSTSNPCGYSSPIPCDDYGHGTHTTGTMLGDDGAGNQIGMAPGAQWIGCRNMDQGWGSPSTYIECFQFFMAPTDLTGQNPDATRRPHVIDNSYDCPPVEGCSTTSLHDAVQAVRAAGIFMSVSAGNRGPACGTITNPPAVEAGVFTVGGIDAGTGALSLGVYLNSSRGPVASGGSFLLKPDLAAPAVNVISSLKGGGYGMLTGTSMAAPHVAGAVALLWSALPSLERRVPATETLLRLSAQRLPVSDTCGGLPAGAAPNNTTGWGLLDILAAYQHFPLKQIFFPLVANQN